MQYIMSVVCVLNVRIPENVFGSYSRKIFFNFLIEDTVTRKMTIRYHHPSIHPSIYPSIHPSIPFEQVRYSIIFCFAVLELFVISVGKNSRQTSIWFEFLAVFFFFFFLWKMCEQYLLLGCCASFFFLFQLFFVLCSKQGEGHELSQSIYHGRIFSLYFFWWK